MFRAGLEKTQVFLKKPVGRLNTGFFRQNRFFKTGFFIENVHVRGSKSVKIQL
jgi:hypothetical protein